jgi:hypothetical protein
MTPERWNHIKALFHGASDLPAAERERWLRASPARDESLVAEVLALLRAHEAASALDAPLQGRVPPEVDGSGDSPFPPGAKVGPFRIEHELGRGGMGVVYKAFDEHLGHSVALKVLAGPHATDPVRRKRLQNEALLAATIHHPGVAMVYRLEQIDGHLFLATEYIAGHTLRSDIACGPLEPARALAITRDILRALAAAHTAGIVHRDLKPENIMVSTDGIVKIVDFGIARSVRFAMTRVTSGGPPGTPAYMAPEQLAGADADARADLYAVGVMLAEMVAGYHPGMAAQGSLPWQLQPTVDRCLARDPMARFQSAGEMLHALAELQESKTHADLAALGWWRFHECTAAAAYGLMTMPAWFARGVVGGATGRVFFLVILASVVAASSLRLHLCFTSFYYPRHLVTLRSQVATAIRLSDLVFVAGLATTALALGDGHAVLVVLLLSVAVGAAVSSVVIEPATTRAAFDR